MFEDFDVLTDYYTFAGIGFYFNAQTLKNAEKHNFI